MYRFSSEIFIIGINPYVPIPKSILDSLLADAKKATGPIPVTGTLNTKSFTQTIVKYAGEWRLYLNGPMRIAANIDVGDIAHVELQYDTHVREELLPQELSVRFETDMAAKNAFMQLPKYRQKEILRYLNTMKSAESLKRNVEKVIQHLHGKEVDLIVLSYNRSKKHTV